MSSQGGTRDPVTGLSPASSRTRLSRGPKASLSLLLHRTVELELAVYLFTCARQLCGELWKPVLICVPKLKLCDVGQVIESLACLPHVNAAGRSHCPRGSDSPGDPLLMG